MVWKQKSYLARSQPIRGLLQWKSMLTPEHNMTKILINILTASSPEKNPFYITTTVAVWSSPACLYEELVLQGFFLLLMTDLLSQQPVGVCPWLLQKLGQDPEQTVTEIAILSCMNWVKKTKYKCKKRGQWNECKGREDSLPGAPNNTFWVNTIGPHFSYQSRSIQIKLVSPTWQTYLLF